MIHGCGLSPSGGGPCQYMGMPIEVIRLYVQDWAIYSKVTVAFKDEMPVKMRLKVRDCVQLDMDHKRVVDEAAKTIELWYKFSGLAGLLADGIALFEFLPAEGLQKN